MFAAIQNQKIIYCVENPTLCEALARGFAGIEEFREWEAALPADEWGRPIKPAAAFRVMSLSGDLLGRYRELERAGYRPGEIMLREALELAEYDPAIAPVAPDESAKGEAGASLEGPALLVDEKALARRQDREVWRVLREERNRLLDESDKYLMPDYPIGEARRAQWRDYRAELRNLTQGLNDPVKVVWPEPPTT